MPWFSVNYFYCSTVWSNTSGKNISKLQSVQSFAVRIVTGTGKFDHIMPALKELRWVPIKQKLYFRNTVLAFKCVSGQAPHYLSDQFTTRVGVTGHTSRSSQLLNILLYKTNAKQRTFYCRIVNIWNSLDNGLKTIKIDLFF